MHLIASEFFGGPERQIVSLADALDPDRYRTVLASFCESGRPNEFLREAQRRRLAAWEVPLRRPWDPRSVQDLYRLLRELRPDVLCTHGFKATFLGPIPALALGIPVIAFSRGWTRENAKVRFYNWLERFSSKHFVDALVAVSRAQAEQLRRFGVRNRDIYILRNAVAVEELTSRIGREDRARLRSELGVEAGCPLIITAGRFSPEKGHAILLQAMQHVLARVGACVLVLCGEGVLGRKLRDMAAALDVSCWCRFAGFRRDLPAVMHAADLMVLPSYSEGLPNVVLEAYALRCPVVATAVGGVPELVTDGVTGLLAPPGEPKALARAIVEMVEDRRRAAGLAEEAFRRVSSEFTFARQAAAFERILSLTMARSTSQARKGTARARTVLRAMGAGTTVESSQGISCPTSGTGPARDQALTAGCLRERPIRVALLIDTFWSVTAGTERQFVEIARRLDRRLFSVYVHCLYANRTFPAIGQYLQSRLPDCPVRVWSYRGLVRPSFPRLLQGLVRSLREDRIDVVHTFLVDSIYVGTLAGRLAGVRAVTTSRRALEYWQTPRDRWLLRLFNPLATRVCANSEAVKRCAIRTEGLPPSKVEVILNGVDLGRRRPGPEDVRRIRQEIGIGPDDLVICVICNLRPVKRLEVFLQAMRAVADAVPRARALIVGSGRSDYAKTLHRLASQLELNHTVLFLGAQESVFRYLWISDLGVLASRSEGLSNALLEYLAAALPVVATRTGGNVEVVDGANGILVPVDDDVSLARAIKELLSDPARRAAMARASLARARERFSWEASMAALRDHYLRLTHRSLPFPSKTSSSVALNSPACR